MICLRAKLLLYTYSSWILGWRSGYLLRGCLRSFSVPGCQKIPTRARNERESTYPRLDQESLFHVTEDQPTDLGTEKEPTHPHTDEEHAVEHLEALKAGDFSYFAQGRAHILFAVNSSSRPELVG